MRQALLRHEKAGRCGKCFFLSLPHPLPCPGAIGLGHQIRPSRSGPGCSLAQSFPFAQQRYDIRLQPIMRFDALRAF